MTREQLLKWWLKPHEYIKYKRAMRESLCRNYTNYIERLDAYLSKIIDDGCDYRHEFHRSIHNFSWCSSKEGHDYWMDISDRRRPLGIGVLFRIDVDLLEHKLSMKLHRDDLYTPF